MFDRGEALHVLAIIFVVAFICMFAVGGLAGCGLNLSLLSR